MTQKNPRVPCVDTGRSVEYEHDLKRRRRRGTWMAVSDVHELNVRFSCLEAGPSRKSRNVYLVVLNRRGRTT